ncbi:MAG: hypothetical protein K2Y23_11240 [Cyanobacteria bacterium]|nr:hypothetical protein [Cyanobacteriota bacterium]
MHRYGKFTAQDGSALMEVQDDGVPQSIAKLGVTNRIEAARPARQRGWL